jgi:hypothetical protein
MKSAYEIAMERFGGDEPQVKLTDEQKAQLAEIDAKYKGKIAERELLIEGQIDKAHEEGDYDALEQLQKQLASDRTNLEAEREEKKEAIRKQASA